VSKAHLDVFSPRTGQSRLVNQPVTVNGGVKVGHWAAQNQAT